MTQTKKIQAVAVPNSVEQIILDFRSKSLIATQELINTQHPIDRVMLVERAAIYRECAERLELWMTDITKFIGMEGEVWDHFSTEDLVAEIRRRYPTILKAHLGTLDIMYRQLRKESSDG